MAFVYKSDPVRGAVWARLFAERAPQYPFHVWPETGDPAAVRFLAAWIPPPDLTRLFPNLEVLFSAAAGIDQFDLAALPPDLPIVRMIEPGIARGMVEYVCWAVLGLHRDMPAYLREQRAEAWTQLRVLPAANRRVGVLGLGVLGCAVLEQLRGFGFDCAGWSRSRHDVAGVACFAGPGELPAFLARTDILVCLLPLTASTRGILARPVFDALPAGAALVNAGRGGHLVEADLLRALDEGRISRAILDVFEPEPLPADHPFWSHPRVLLTPHVASDTQRETAAEAILENIARHRAGEPLLGLIDRSHGY